MPGRDEIVLGAMMVLLAAVASVVLLASKRVHCARLARAAQALGGKLAPWRRFFIQEHEVLFACHGHEARLVYFFLGNGRLTRLLFPAPPVAPFTFVAKTRRRLLPGPAPAYEALHVRLSDERYREALLSPEFCRAAVALCSPPFGADLDVRASRRAFSIEKSTWIEEPRLLRGYASLAAEMYQAYLKACGLC